MIGFYDYTVLLTYGSVISAVVGIILALSGSGHPYIAIFLLMFSGLCDAFDGRVARTKKDRTEQMRNFGIQIDSLADLAAFGILPVCIGVSLYGRAQRLELGGFRLPLALVIVVSCLYILGALIRLAYFNVTEEEMQSSGQSKRKFYTGLPVTSAALIFPTFVLIDRLIPADLTWVYHVVMLATAAAFVGKFRLRKPGFKTILVLVAIGLVEFLLFFLNHFVIRHG